MSDERTTIITKHCPRCLRDTQHKHFDSDPGNKTGYTKDVCTFCGRQVIINKQIIFRNE